MMMMMQFRRERDLDSIGGSICSISLADLLAIRVKVGFFLSSNVIGLAMVEDIVEEQKATVLVHRIGSRPLCR